MKSNTMDAATFWLPIVGGILLGGIAGNAWYGGNRVLALWLGFAGVVCFLLVATLQIQRSLSSVKGPPPFVTISSISFPDVIIKPGPIIIRWGIKNRSMLPVTIVEANMTLWFETDHNPLPPRPQYVASAHKLTGIDIGIGDTFPATFQRAEPLNQDAVDQINASKLVLYVYGFVRVSDRDGGVGCRGFLAQYTPGNDPAFGMFRNAGEDHPTYRNCP
jgi:hypothetical protein